VVFSADETTELRNYTLAKQHVTASVRALKQLLETQKKPDFVEEAQGLLVKLAEDRFNLAVVGQFKRGKSSLMNAVIGRDLLPTGLLPLTSAITTLCYGSPEQVMLRRKGWAFEQEISLKELADYITERGNPGNEKELIEARVELSVPFLRRGLHFIDTPGVGSARQENTATTYSFLPEADAVIFVTSVEAPLSETEQNFLHDIRNHVRKLFVIVNKLDLLDMTEREDVLKYIQTGINTTLGTPDIRLYPVSARQALEAKLHGDVHSLQQSGLVAMEEALTSFLAREQGRTFLVAILDRALNLSTGIDNGSLKSTTEDQNLMESEQSVDGLREAMESLRSALLSNAELSPIPRMNKPISTDVELIDKAIAVSQQEQPRTNLRSGTCPICSAQSQTLFDFFARWQYTLATSESAQHAFTASYGFCALHTWQFQQIASPQGVSEGYAPLVETVLTELRSILNQPSEESGLRVETLLSSTETCAVCRLMRETEVEQIRQLLVQLATAEGRRLFLSSEGLCLPHLQAAIISTSDTEIIHFLLQEQIRHLEEISEDMRGYTLKRDALRRGLLNAQERNAWRRALVQLVGERTVQPNRKRTL
jgi:GTP-binding protein EngB required for normal cell division